MKHQISKVALIATLAFIGAGFAGTQQAKATDCGTPNCGSQCFAADGKPFAEGDGCSVTQFISDDYGTKKFCTNCNAKEKPCTYHMRTLYIVKVQCVNGGGSNCESKSPYGPIGASCTG